MAQVLKATKADLLDGVGTVGSPHTSAAFSHEEAGEVKYFAKTAGDPVDVTLQVEEESPDENWHAVTEPVQYTAAGEQDPIWIPGPCNRTRVVATVVSGTVDVSAAARRS